MGLGISPLGIARFRLNRGLGTGTADNRAVV